jgi:xanthosine utilization system XapX-like protein
MRYTKIALLTFGAGLIVGLIVVVVEINTLDRVASGLMALGLFGIPLGMIVDWRLATKAARQSAKRRAKYPTRRSPAVPPRRAPRPRKPPPPKR